MAVFSGTGTSDNFQGTGGDDDINAGNGGDFIVAGAGDDEIRSGSGRDKIIAGDGNDEVYSGNNKDVARGNDGNDRINSAQSDDVISGRTGNDFLDAGDGNDEVFGGIGSDYIVGDNGDDRLYGDSRSDMDGDTDYFAFDDDDGNDKVMNFEVNIDKIYLRDGGSPADVTFEYNADRDFTVMTYGDTTVQFKNVDLTSAAAQADLFATGAEIDAYGQANFGDPDFNNDFVV